MPTWLVILLLIELIILLANPSEAGYAWLQSLRRPGWLRFHVWSPLIRLSCYAGVYLSLLLVLAKDSRSGWMFAYLVLILISELGVWITCQIRSLALGSSFGAGAGLASLVLAHTVHPLNPLASLALMPFMTWSLLDNLAQFQMKTLNSESGVRKRPRPTAATAAVAALKDVEMRSGGRRQPR